MRVKDGRCRFGSTRGDCQSQKGEKGMPTIAPETGPVAVTGASGYIGSWIVKDCVEQGYQVRACIRDKSKPEKVDHLLAMNEAGYPGRVELVEADLLENGSYCEPFA
jgi:nucleoside-diphosphate-sugar epimerase